MASIWFIEYISTDQHIAGLQSIPRESKDKDTVAMLDEQTMSLIQGPDYK